MSWHIAAFTLNAAAFTDTPLQAITDSYLDIIGTDLRLRRRFGLRWAWGGSTLMSRARFDSATLQLIGRPQIVPFDRSPTPIQNPNVWKGQMREFSLPPGETIQCQFTSTTAVAEQATVIVSLMDRVDPLPAGNIQWVRATSTTAAVANKWSPITYTLDRALPTGKYALVSSHHQSAAGQAHRWIFNDQRKRPGLLSVTALNNRAPDMNYEYSEGTMGLFVNTSLPIMEVLCNGADAVHEIYLAVVQVSSEFAISVGSGD